MFSALTNAFTRTALSWWRSRLPTRESIVVSALLVVLFVGCYLAAFFVRSELLLKTSDADMIIRTVGFVVAVKFLIFYWRGLAHRPWRAAHFEDLNNVLRAATTALLVFVAVNYYFGSLLGSWPLIPRSVLLLDWAFTLLGVGGMQAIARSLYEEIFPATNFGAERSVLVIDASPQGRELARSLPGIAGRNYFVAGLLDDDPAFYGEHVSQARVLGPVSMAPACAERLRVREIVIREGSIYGSRLRALCDACAAIDVRVTIAEHCDSSDSVPGLKRLTVPRLTIRDIELRDLMSRPQARLTDRDVAVLPLIEGRTIMVTGAGGSIGSEICRQLIRFSPAKLLLVERSEIALFTIHRELTGSADAGDTVVEPLLCDITHADRMEHVFLQHKPAVVFHAAAYKHVPLMEAHPLEAIENNTLATATLAELADAHGVETFVALSTDKAVHPSSIMGASKLVAERFLQAFNAASATEFVVVRFGNVLGSSGSAVPIFSEQLARRQTITITDPEVRRFFMTIDEAAQLVLLAGGLSAEGGTFVLEMGESVPIVDLVARLAFVMKVPQDEVRIEYCGLRPGEKLDEELFFGDERRSPTANPLVTSVSRPARRLADVRHWLGELKSTIAGGDPQAAAQALMEIVAADCAEAGRFEAAPSSFESATSHASERRG
jgi:FlaA1/EpsC-like NDP-sugar epimerase